MVCEIAEAVGVAARGKILKRADADVARGNARQHSTGQHRLAKNLLAGRNGREGARGRDAQRVHGLGDDVFAQHRPERGAAVAAARKRRRHGARQLDVFARAVAADNVAEQDRAAVAELR